MYMHRYIRDRGFLFFGLYVFSLFSLILVTLNVRTFRYERWRKKRKSWSSKRIWLLLFTLFFFFVVLFLFFCVKKPNVATVLLVQTWTVCTNSLALFRLRLLCMIWKLSLWSSNVHSAYWDECKEALRTILYSFKDTIEKFKRQHTHIA